MSVPLRSAYKVHKLNSQKSIISKDTHIARRHKKVSTALMMLMKKKIFQNDFPKIILDKDMSILKLNNSNITVENSSFNLVRRYLHNSANNSIKCFNKTASPMERKFQLQKRFLNSYRRNMLSSFFNLFTKNKNNPGLSDAMDISFESLLSGAKGQPEAQRNLLDAYNKGLMQSMRLIGKEKKSPRKWWYFAALGVFIMYASHILSDIESPLSEQNSIGTTESISWPHTHTEKLADSWEVIEKVPFRFSDVHGCDEVKQELEDVVQFLSNPKKLSRIGARLPKGVLLIGPPGVGKTLLAKAVAGEAKVPFFQVSGSEFDEMYVGTGASRIRKLFSQAKIRAPCVVFIDELDAVGGKRTSSPLHPYANQTINQLLSEMDGFTSSTGIIILGATNRANALDKALLRPGRFDLHVHVSVPDLCGRKKLFSHYLGSVISSTDVDVGRLAAKTAGFTGADIQNMVNQAALATGLAGGEEVGMKELWTALDKIMMGPARQRLPDEETMAITACHEAGHALVAYYSSEFPLIHKVTVISRGASLGHTSFISEKEEYNKTLAQLKADLDTSLGGRVAEEIKYGPNKVTTGASHDFEHATGIALAMVKKFGMSRLGVRQYDEESKDKLAPSTKEAIDDEVRRILDESYERARAIIQAHNKEHDNLTHALLKYETLDGQDVKDIFNGDSNEVAKRFAQREKEKKSKLSKNSS